mgnify:CR=1 FL=1
MYCEYGGLKYKIKKKNNKYIITSRVRKEGFTNYIDVLGNKHSELYMKIVKDKRGRYNIQWRCIYKI